MEQRNNNQNSVIFQVEEILNKMSNQVSFLIRKDKLMNQLDVDLLMENTRKLYNTLCSVKCNMNIDSIPMEIVEENSEFQNFRTSENFEDENSETQRLGDSVTFEEENSELQNLKTSETFEEEIFEEEKNAETHRLIDLETPKEEDSGIRAYKKEPQTIGDILELIEDNSLAARLQRKPVSDLMSAIGINDKFLLLNELFGGSMDKYNRSIRALNNFPTLLGARTYMSELQIEFQWDCNSEAYKKLSDLIERRFCC
ncbi:MAG: hypothetical protein IJZ87_05870 [Bacteroidales bacterium]|nr:hypothetical protein [Bacteroidales bacterium]